MDSSCWKEIQELFEFRESVTHILDQWKWAVTHQKTQWHHQSLQKAASCLHLMDRHCDYALVEGTHFPVPLTLQVFPSTCHLEVTHLKSLPLSVILMMNHFWTYSGLESWKSFHEPATSCKSSAHLCFTTIKDEDIIETFLPIIATKHDNGAWWVFGPKLERHCRMACTGSRQPFILHSWSAPPQFNCICNSSTHS